MPLYKLLKKSYQFLWNDEAQEAFDKLKAFLASPLTSISPRPDEPLLLYITATMQVVSTTLIVEHVESGHVLTEQRPMYLISKVLSDTKGPLPPNTKDDLCHPHRHAQSPPLLLRAIP